MENANPVNAMHRQTLLKAQREKLGLTQQQVADTIAVHIRQYQRFESGERSISGMSFRIGVAIADVLELDVHELVNTPNVDEYLENKREYDRLQKLENEEE